MSVARYSACVKWRGAVAVAAIACYSPLFLAEGWIRDDRALIAENPVMAQAAGALVSILTTGYHEAVMGRGAPIQEYRPLVTLSFWAQRQLMGSESGPMRAANVLLHLAVCLLAFEALRRRLAEGAAGAAALIFAVMPVHAEAVSYITSRSELLTAASLMGSWLLLSGSPTRSRLAAGLAAYAAGLFSKEHALLIPAFLALADWTLDGKRPWERGRRGVHLGLFAVTALYWGARSAVLDDPVHGGLPYFSSRLTAAFTMARFALARYALPSVAGIGLCADFTRPLIADESGTSPSAWAGLGVWLIFIIAASAAALRRRAWGFWALAPLLFLLPTSHLLVPLDTIGAERFLYIPTLGLAAGLGAAWARLKIARPRLAPAALAALTLWYAGAGAARNAMAWTSERAYYEAACACNPVSARARSGLATTLLMGGDERGGLARLEEAGRLDPSLPDVPYNLARLAWLRGDASQTLLEAQRSLHLFEGNADAWILLALAQEKLGRRPDAEKSLRRALDVLPWSPVAHFNLGRLLLLEDRRPEAATHLRRFVELAPADPDAERVARLLGEPR